MYLTFTADSLRVFEEERAFSPFRVSFESWCEALGAQHKTDHEMDEVALEKFAVDISKSEQWEKVMSMAGDCLLYTSPSPRDKRQSRMPSSA